MQGCHAIASSHSGKGQIFLHSGYMPRSQVTDLQRRCRIQTCLVSANLKHQTLYAIHCGQILRPHKSTIYRLPAAGCFHFKRDPKALALRFYTSTLHGSPLFTLWLVLRFKFLSTTLQILFGKENSYRASTVNKWSTSAPRFKFHAS